MPIDQNNYYVSGQVAVTIWAKKAGVWQAITTGYGSVFQNVGSAGQHTLGWQIYETFDLGPGVQAFGASLESHDGIAASVNDLAGVSWTATATSGERSATPGGQLSTVTVTPR